MLLDDARQACERQDPDAHETLLQRIIRQYPNSDEASLARQLLEKERGSDASCS